MSQTPIISIVLVSCNSHRWLHKCLSSIYSQSLTNFEVILVDNASSDNTINFLSKNYPQVRIISLKNNLGFAAGNNAGIKATRGKYMLLLNIDTWLPNNFLAQMLNSFLKSNCDVLGAMETDYFSPRHEIYTTTMDPLGTTGRLSGRLEQKKLFYISGACMFFKKRLYQTTGGFDNDFFMYNEEVDWCWRLHLLSKKIYLDPTIFFGHAGSSFPFSINYERFCWRNQNTLLMLLKNYRLYNLSYILPMYFCINIIEVMMFLILLKPQIAFSYAQAWAINLKYVSSTLAKRREIQNSRLVSDQIVLQKMFWSISKWQQLQNFLSSLMRPLHENRFL